MAEHDLPYDVSGQIEDPHTGLVASPILPMLPEFTTAVRGYDRGQVDEYITRLHEWLAEAEERVRVTEAARLAAKEHIQTVSRQLISLERQSGGPTPRSVTTYVDRMKEVVLEAVEAAQKFKDDAYDEGDGIRQAATEEGQAILAKARAEASQLLGSAQSEERAIRQKITELTSTRERLVAELAQMQDHLADVLHRPLAAERAELESPEAQDVAPSIVVEPVDDDLPEATALPSEEITLFDQEA